MSATHSIAAFRRMKSASQAQCSDALIGLFCGYPAGGAVASGIPRSTVDQLMRVAKVNDDRYRPSVQRGRSVKDSMAAFVCPHSGIIA